LGFWGFGLLILDLHFDEEMGIYSNPLEMGHCFGLFPASAESMGAVVKAVRRDKDGRAEDQTHAFGSSSKSSPICGSLAKRRTSKGIKPITQKVF